MAHASGRRDKRQAPVSPCPFPQAPSSLSPCSLEEGVLLDHGLQQHEHSSSVGHLWADTTKIRGQDKIHQPPVSGSRGSKNLFMGNKLKTEMKNVQMLTKQVPFSKNVLLPQNASSLLPKHDYFSSFLSSGLCSALSDRCVLR